MPLTLKVDGGVTRRLLDRLESFRELARKSWRRTLSFSGQLRIELQFSVETDRARGGKANVGRAQKQFVDRHDAGTDVIFHLGLFEMELHQFVDLQDLAKRDEQTVLLQFAIAQENFAPARERIAVGGFALGVEKPFHAGPGSSRRDLLR